MELRSSLTRLSTLAPILAILVSLQPHATLAATAPAWVTQIAPGTWGAIGLNTLSSVDPEKDPNLNPNFPDGAPWHAVEGQSGVLQDWTGGALASGYGTHGALLVHGGGHNGYFGSEVYAFDLGTQLWTRITDPYAGPFNWPYESTTYPDGSPVPNHTYDYVDYHPGTNSFVVMRSIRDGVHSTTNTDEARTHLLDLDTGKWRHSQRNNGLRLSGGGSSCFDRNRDVFWIMGPYSTKLFAKFDPNVTNNDGTTGSYTNYIGDHVDIDTNADCDPIRDIYVYTEFRVTDKVYARNLKDPAAPRVTLSETGDIPTTKDGGGAWVWSDKRQAFLYWRRGAGIYEFKHVAGDWATGTWRWTNLTNSSNVVIPVDMRKDNGVYSRLRIARYDDTEVAVVVNRIDGPVYAFRIPDGSTSNPTPTITLSASPRSITSGQASVLTWTTTNATACTASGSWTGARGPNGSESSGPLTSNKTYTLDCQSSAGVSSRASVTVSVSTTATPNPVNVAPLLSGTPPVTVLAETAYSFRPDASDSDGDSLTFTVENKPSWASFNSSNGTLSGTPGAGDVGTISGIRISVTDGEVSVSLPLFSITVEIQGTLSGTLSWTPPTVEADGTPLEDLAGYKIYFGTASRAYTQTVRLTNPGITSHTIEGLLPGTYYFAVTGFDQSDNESELSEEVVGVLKTTSSVGGGSTGGSDTGGSTGGTGTGGSPDTGTEGSTGGISAIGPIDVALLAAMVLLSFAINRPLRHSPRTTISDSGVASMKWNTCSTFVALVALCTASSGVRADDADFQRRCASPGVLRCIGFDSPSDLVVGTTSDSLWLIPGANIHRASIDTSTKASGGGSLRFDIPENVGTANMAGKWVQSLGDQFGSRNLARFAGKSKVYIQVRQRFTDAFTHEYNLGKMHFKQFAINNTDKCGDEVIVTENSQGHGIPKLYSDCGSEHYIVKDAGTNATVYQQGDYWCIYADATKGNYSRCAPYRANQWITFYYEIEFGDEDVNNTWVRAYIQYEGQSMKQFIDFRTARFNFDRDNGERQSLQNISLLPYITGKTSEMPNEAATTWYDEVIVSREPIPAPDGEVPATPTVDNVAPAAPTDLSFN